MKKLVCTCLMLAMFGMVGCGMKKDNTEINATLQKEAPCGTVQEEKKDISTEMDTAAEATSEFELVDMEFAAEMETEMLETEKNVVVEEEYRKTEAIVQEDPMQDDISMIRITDGSNGSRVEITDADMLNEFLEKIEAIQLLEEEEASTVNQSVGYQYMVKLLDEQGAVVHKLLLQGDVVVMDKVIYKTAGTEDITAYITEMY